MWTAIAGLALVAVLFLTGVCTPGQWSRAFNLSSQETVRVVEKTEEKDEADEATDDSETDEDKDEKKADEKKADDKSTKPAADPAKSPTVIPDLPSEPTPDEGEGDDQDDQSGVFKSRTVNVQGTDKSRSYIADTGGVEVDSWGCNPETGNLVCIYADGRDDALEGSVVVEDGHIAIFYGVEVKDLDDPSRSANVKPDCNMAVLHPGTWNIHLVDGEGNEYDLASADNSDKETTRRVYEALEDWSKFDCPPPVATDKIKNFFPVEKVAHWKKAA